MSQPTARLHGLDFLRALMMMLGVVLHAAQMYLTLPIVDYYWDSARSPSMDLTLIFINTFRMPVFFMLSGFFTALLLLRRGESDMFENRKKRILVPFLLFLPILAAVMTPLRIVGHTLMVTGELGFDASTVQGADILWNNTHNLWFLYYLLFYLGTVWLGLKLWSTASDTMKNQALNAVQSKPIVKSMVFYGVCMGLAILGGLHEAGRVSASLSFVPKLDVYLYFGLCFLLGWVLYLRAQDLEILAARWKKDLLIATFLFVLALVAFGVKDGMQDEVRILAHGLLSLLTGFSIGCYMLGFVGLFSQHFQTYSPWVRYMSDSAYWVFIFHSVPQVVLAIAVAGWAVPAEVKFLVVLTVSFAICLLTYQLFVRKGRIGEILNGRRYPSPPFSR